MQTGQKDLRDEQLTFLIKHFYNPGLIEVV
jgi:hypothetical protein